MEKWMEKWMKFCSCLLLQNTGSIPVKGWWHENTKIHTSPHISPTSQSKERQVEQAVTLPGSLDQEEWMSTHVETWIKMTDINSISVEWHNFKWGVLTCVIVDREWEGRQINNLLMLYMTESRKCWENWDVICAGCTWLQVNNMTTLSSSGSPCQGMEKYGHKLVGHLFLKTPSWAEEEWFRKWVFCRSIECLCPLPCELTLLGAWLSLGHKHHVAERDCEQSNAWLFVF